MAKQTGTSTGGIEVSPRYRRKQARRRREEEKAWAEQNGPVILRIGDVEWYLKPQAVRDLKRIRKAILGGGDDLEELVEAGVVRPGP